MLANIQEIKSKSLRWVNVSKVSKKEMDYLKNRFKFHSLHLADCLSPFQRPKLDVDSKYLFMVLLFPVYKRKERKIISSEVDFFITSDLVVTVHHNEISPLINFFNICQISKKHQKKYLSGNPVTLLYEILNRLLLYCNPMIDHLDMEVNNIEEHIFRGYERRMVREILIAKRNITNFRRTMQVHHSVIQKLLTRCELFFSPGKLKIYFKEIIETSDDIWGRLENLAQVVDSIEQTNNSLISFRLNDIMKILAIVSAVILPANLISSLYGMNLKFLPLANHPFSLPVIIIGMILVISIMVFTFKRKKWF